MTDLDADLASPSPPDWMRISAYDALRWPVADRNERRRMQGRAAERLHEEFIAEHERRERAKAEDEAEARATLPVVPSLDDCNALVLSNPGALTTMQERALTAYRQTRSLPGAPYQQLDVALGEFRRAMANQPAAVMLQTACEVERYFCKMALKKNEFSFLAWRNEEARRSAIELAAAEQRRLSGQAFDPSKFLSSLAARGISLVVLSDGEHLRATGNADALTGTDIAILEQNRGAILTSLKLTRDL